jgi:hypothetical protein
MVVDWLAPSTVKMEVICSSETPGDFQRAKLSYISLTRTLQNYESMCSFLLCMCLSKE